MCRWWKDNLNYLSFDVRDGIWKIGVSDVYNYDGYDLVVIRYCPGCGNRLSHKGCIDKCRRCGRPSRENWCVFCQTYKYIEMVGGE